jgi:hypothetical protein
MPAQKPVHPVPDDARDDYVVTPEEEALIRERLETADEDEKSAIPWEEVREPLRRRAAARPPDK